MSNLFGRQSIHVPQRPLSDEHRKILAFVVANPACTRPDIAWSTGIQAQTLTARLLILIDRDLVDPEYGLGIAPDRFTAAPTGIAEASCRLG